MNQGQRASRPVEYSEDRFYAKKKKENLDRARGRREASLRCNDSTDDRFCFTPHCLMRALNDTLQSILHVWEAVSLWRERALFLAPPCSKCGPDSQLFLYGYLPRRTESLLITKFNYSHFSVGKNKKMKGVVFLLYERNFFLRYTPLRKATGDVEGKREG